MILIKDTIDVAVPVRIAYDEWARYEGLPNLMKAVREVTGDERHLHWASEVQGRRVHWDASAIDQVPDQLISLRAPDGQRHPGLVRFEPLGDSETRLTLQLEYDMDTTLGNVAEAFGATADEIRRELENFKGCVERQACAPRGGGIDGND
jgi:uncharacterized membrane protein